MSRAVELAKVRQSRIRLPGGGRSFGMATIVVAATREAV